ncbi:hypothetical protein B7463_g10310, partial [Scytalidium lignicola]
MYDMGEALCSILWQERERWRFDDEQAYIAFREDNTGTLCAGGGFCWSILATIKWKATAIEPLNHNQISQDQQSPHLLGQLNLEITLTKDLPSWAQNGLHAKNPMLNGGALTDDAFQPKSFLVRIEQGKFATPANIEVGFSPDCDANYTKRLVFNRSPYPPESEWKEAWKEDWLDFEGHNWWDCKEFVGYFLPNPSVNIDEYQKHVALLLEKRFSNHVKPS